jgi:hypothetical protein
LRLERVVSVHQFTAKVGLPLKSSNVGSRAKAVEVPRKGIWWLSPFGLIVGFLIPIFFGIMLLGEIRSPALTVRGIRYLDIGYSLVGIGLMALMALTALIGQQIQFKGHSVPVHERNWEVPAWVLGLISVFAYMVWFREIFFSPATLFGILTGSIQMGRDQIAKAPGVSSLVNFMPIFFALFTHVLTTRPSAVSKALRCLAALLVALTVFRVYVWSERLALIEVGVAVVVPWVCARHQSMSPGWRRMVFFLPLIGLPFVILYFGIGEFFRSWQSDFYQGKMPFWEFVTGRFASYYYTSLNNGAGLLVTQTWPTYKFEFTMAFAYKAPWILGALFRYYSELDYSSLGYFLQRYADPEFNNPSGLYTVVYDLGVAGALVYFSVLGFLCGLLYRAIIDGRARGVLLYPMCFVMMLELYRYPYFGESRSFTAFLGVGLTMLLLARKKRTN